MTPSKFLFCLTWVLLWNNAETDDLKKTTVHQERGFLSAHVGGNLTLSCFYDSDVSRYYWYKQALGQKMQLISISHKLDKSGTFHNEFKDNPSFKLETDPGKSRLKISDLQVSDTGTYFCVSALSFMFEFGQGTTVSVKHSGLENKALVHQSASETIHPGGSVTLNCTVQTGTCDGEHSVYWFRNSEDSHPGLIYTRESRNDQCERKPNTQTHACVYNLPVKNLDESLAGTYYCAVVSCGRILFGNGTKLELKSGVASWLVVYFLSGALTLTIILSVLLAFIMNKMHRRDSCQTSELKVQFSAHPRNGENHQDPNSLQYAAVNVNLSRRSRSQKNAESDCVYSSIKQ
ncbi:immunoglobulin kappa light chain [Kryptolebias marmoratus]|uniref:Immunoglobulin kappa light chain-like n=1 Tax=Kryptolebias marmoratus TaxID=37003 RepID=A0A3Q3B1X0_KRYMA|nr:immunoglobulin kappa light chain [Kryptolebias marmoratus]